jgi:hypothetical protein
MKQIDQMRRRAARYLDIDPVTIAPARGVFSLSFDDFPASAWTEAGPVLADHGVKATYYVCGGLADGINMDRDQFRVPHLQALHAGGVQLQVPIIQSQPTQPVLVSAPLPINSLGVLAAQHQPQQPQPQALPTVLSTGALPMVHQLQQPAAGSQQQVAPAAAVPDAAAALAAAAAKPVVPMNGTLGGVTQLVVSADALRAPRAAWGGSLPAVSCLFYAIG